jgi:hypothetical protein
VEEVPKCFEWPSNDCLGVHQHVGYLWTGLTYFQVHGLMVGFGLDNWKLWTGQTNR